MIVARYWTLWFGVLCFISYFLVYPFIAVFPIFLQNVLDSWDMHYSGIAVNVMATPFFWIALITVYSMTFTVRYLERSLKWLFRPDDNMMVAEYAEFKALHAEDMPSGDQIHIALSPLDASLGVEDPTAVRTFFQLLPATLGHLVLPRMVCCQIATYILVLP
jgi:hypothetical protein